MVPVSPDHELKSNGYNFYIYYEIHLKIVILGCLIFGGFRIITAANMKMAVTKLETRPYFDYPSDMKIEARRVACDRILNICEFMQIAIRSLMRKHCFK